MTKIESLGFSETHKWPRYKDDEGYFYSTYGILEHRAMSILHPNPDLKFPALAIGSTHTERDGMFPFIELTAEELERLESLKIDILHRWLDHQRKGNENAPQISED